MARKPTDVQVQVVMTKKFRKALAKAALQHQDDVPRERMMDRGPMIRYVMSWFLEQPAEEQIAIILAGQEAYEAGYGVEDEPPTSPASARDVGPHPGDRADDDVRAPRLGGVALPGDEHGGTLNPVVRKGTAKDPLPKRNRKRPEKSD